MNFNKNPLFFGFFSTAAFWAFVFAALSAIPFAARRAVGAKFAPIQLVLSKNRANFAKNPQISSLKNDDKAILQSDDEKSGFSEVISAEKTEAIQHFETVKPVEPAKADLPKEIHVAAKPASKVESRPQTAKPISAAPAQKAEMPKAETFEIPPEIAIENESEKISEIAEDNAEFSENLQEEAEESPEEPQGSIENSAEIEPVATSERYLSADFSEETFGAKMFFEGFFSSADGVFALKDSVGRAIAFVGKPKIEFSEETAKSLPDFPIRVSFRVLSTGAVPVSGVSVSPALAAEIQNEIKLSVSNWRFSATAQSANLAFSFEVHRDE